MKIQAAVKSVIRHNNNAVTIIFDRIAGFKHLPGQFINVIAEIEGELLSRSYSLSSIDDEDDSPSITVKRVEGGLVSNYLVDHAEESMQFAIEGPFGAFVFDTDTQSINDIVLVAGGSGISPILSILKHVLKHTTNRVLLICCNRTKNEIIYRHLIHHLAEIYSGRLQVHHFLSKEETQTDNFHAGRLSRLALKKLIKSLSADHVNANYFVCGPAGLIELTEGAVQSLSVHENNFHKESFITETPEKINDTTFEVLFNTHGSVRLIDVLPDTSLLQAALEERIELNYSCRSGNCGICVAKKQSGKVWMQNNYALTTEQVEDDLILLCQSYPLDNEVSVFIP